MANSSDMTTPTTYGRCPECGGRGVSRERRPNGNDTCENWHTYPSRNALLDPVKPPAMTTPTTAEPQYTVSQGAEVAKEFTGTSNGATIRMGFEILKLRATIARLEGDKQNLLNDILRCIPADWGRMAHGWEPGHIGNMLAEYVDELRTRADAAERRVEALTSDAAVEAAAKASWELVRDAVWDDTTDEMKAMWRRESLVTIRAALAAASGVADGAATTEG